MSILKIEMSDWLYNAGIVGLINALGCDISEHKNKNNTYIEIDTKDLEGFEDKYFAYLIKKYEIFTSYHKIVSFKDKTESILNDDEYLDENIDKVLKEANKQIDFLKQKLVSNSYINAYPVIKQDVDSKNSKDDGKGYDYIVLSLMSKDLKKITKTKKESIEDVKKHIKEQAKNILKIIEFAEKEEVKKHLLAKDLTYTIVQYFWTNRSFLSRKKNKENIYKEYREYFLNPILDPIKESENANNPENSSNTDEGSEKNKKKSRKRKDEGPKGVCFNCGVDLMEINKSHNLTWINNIGVDGAKKASHFWNMECIDTICPVCSLVYSCIPLGFIFLKGQGLFVNNNASIGSLVNSNKHILKDSTKILELEYESYAMIANTFTKLEHENMTNSSKRVKNVQIVKLDVDRVTPYSFSILNKEMIKFMIDNSEKIDYLLDKRVEWYTDGSNSRHYKDLYKETIDNIYRGKNFFDLIDFIVMKKVKGAYIDFKATGNLLAINTNFLKKQEVGCMQDMNVKRIYAIRQRGYELKEAYKNRNLDNKIPAILNKLSNCLHIKNADKFLDTVLDSYGYIGKEVPSVFAECLNNEELFLTVGYAFVLGFAGEKVERKNKKDDNDTNNNNEQVNEGVNTNE